MNIKPLREVDVGGEAAIPATERRFFFFFGEREGAKLSNSGGYKDARRGVKSRELH